MASSLQLGVFYALLAGVIWGISPLLFKRGLTSSEVVTVRDGVAASFIVVGIFVLSWS